MFELGLESINMDATIILKPRLPAPGSDEEPAWLANCCRAVAENRWYCPSAEDLEELSKIEHFEFAISEVSLRFLPVEVEENFYGAFEGNDDMMVALEGLCWE